MRDDDQTNRIADDGLVEHASPACTALAPVVQAAQWSRQRPHPRPSAIFVTHLIATVEQVPQTCGLGRAAASDATAAYTANRHRAVGTGLRERQIV